MTILYELTKKLKDAGFSQNRKGSSIYECECEGTKDSGLTITLHKKECSFVYIPTLSELIEACGESFSSLHSVAIGFRADGWDEKSSEEYPIRNFQEVGSTPEEAIANLWLKLNKK